MLLRTDSPNRPRRDPLDPLSFYTYDVTPGSFPGGLGERTDEQGRIGLPVALQEAVQLPESSRADTSMLTAAQGALTNAHQQANAEARKEAARQARLRANLHLYTQGIGAPLQWMTGVDLGLPDGSDAVQAASEAGAVAAEGRAQNALRQAEEQANIARIESGAENDYRRRDEQRRTQQALMDNRVGNANTQALADATRDVLRLNREEELQAWQRGRQAQADARAAANAAHQRDRQRQQDALARLEVLGKLGLLDRATDDEIADSGFDRDVLEAYYAPQAPDLPPALSAAANVLMPLPGQSRGTGFFGLEPATRGYGQAEDYLKRLGHQLPKLQDDLRKEWVKLSPREQQAYGAQYGALLGVLGDAGDTGDVAAIETFNEQFMPLVQADPGSTHSGGSRAEEGVSIEELFRMADEFLEAEGEASTPRGEGDEGTGLRAGQEVEVPEDAVRVPLRELATSTGLYPPSLQRAIRGNGSLDGLKVVVLDDNGHVIPFGDTVVLDSYAAISDGIARARDFARRERLESLNAEQAARMRAQSPGGPSDRAPGVYGGGGSR